MFKLIVVALVLVFFLTTASAFSEIETYEDAVPILQTTGEKLYLTITQSVDYIQQLIEVWSVEEV